MVFPMHPRTRAAIERANLWHFLEAPFAKQLKVVEPMRYLEFVGLLQDARLVITDSGGLQEETTALGVPCLTMRENTERPITFEKGTNRLIGQSADSLRNNAITALSSPWPQTPEIDHWDGHAAERIVERLAEWFRTSRGGQPDSTEMPLA